MNFWDEYNARPDVGYAANPEAPNYRRQPQQKQKQKKSFWLDQISTAGGILGGIGGSFVAPIAGTAGGAAAGSALGEAIEKMIAPKSTDWGDVAQEGVLGGVLGAGPIKLAKGGFAGAKALATGGDDVVAKASQAALTPLRQTLGQSVTGSADNLAVKQFRLNKSQLTGLRGVLKEDPGTFIRKYGFHSADDITTKAIDPLQKEFDTVVSTLGNIPKSQVKTGLDKFITPLKNSVSLDDQRIAKQLQSQADEILKKSGNSMTGQDVLALRQLFDEGVKRSAFGSAELSVNKGTADALRKTLQEAADKAGLKTSDGRTLKEAGLELNKLRTLHKAVAPNEELGRGNLPLNLPTLLGGVTGAAAGGAPMAAGAALSTAAVNSPTGRRLAMAGADKLGNKLINSGTKAAGQSRKGIAARVGAGGVYGGLAGQAQQQPQSLEDALSQSLANSDTSMMNAPNSMPPMNSDNMGGLYPDGQQSSSPYSKQNLMADIQRDPENAKQYIAMYSQLSEIFAPQSAQEAAPGFGRPSAQLYSQATTGLASIDQLEQQLAQNPSLATRNATPGQNIPGLGGLVSRAAGTNQYRAAANNILNSIARINTGAAMPASEEAFYNRTYLPQPGDTPQAIQAKIQNLRQFFYPIANYKAASSGGGTSLEDALMQYGGAQY